MILTCPACATRYVVADGAVPPDGRTVRCANCGERWRALPEPDAPMELAAAADPARSPSPSPVPPPGFGRAVGEAPVSKAFRQQVQDRRRTRQAAATGAMLAVASAVVLLLVLVLALFPVAVVRVFPRMAGVYAALKHPVNPTGLALEAQGESGLVAGRPVLVVHGLERNVEARPRMAVPLRVSLFDKAGRAAAVQVVHVDRAPIAPGETRPFRAVFTDPPLSAVEFGVELAFDIPATRDAPSVPPVASRPPRAALASPAAAEPPVSEARPLPAGSPYALPSAAAAAAGPHG